MARAPADFASWYPKGVRFTIQVDPEDPTKARLAARPYDATEPIAWAAIPLGGAVPLVAGRWRSWRRNAATAEAGPWWEASAQVLCYGEVTTTLAWQPQRRRLKCRASIRQARTFLVPLPALPGREMTRTRFRRPRRPRSTVNQRSVTST